VALSRTDPYLAYTFRVEIDGIVEGGFSEVTGLQSELETFDYREGGRNDYVHRLAGPVRYPQNLVLRRGLASSSLWDWYSDAAAGNIRRASAAVLLCDASGETVWRWSFTDAYPVRWTGPDLRAASAAVAVEAVELAHRGLADSESGIEKLLHQVERTVEEIGRELGF
jgi:phage tail-like protein